MSDKKTFDALVNLLRPQMEYRDDRQAFVRGALFNCDVLNQIEWGSSANTFTVHLVHALFKFGDCSGRPAIVMLLEDLKLQIGNDKHKQIDALIAAYSQSVQESPSRQKRLDSESSGKISPSVDQNNERGTNLNSTGDDNNIAARDIHIYNYASTLPEPQQAPVSNKSLIERYNDLPTDEDRARFRALGVLPSHQLCTDLILSELWKVKRTNVEIYAHVLIESNLLELIKTDLYQQPTNIRLEAKTILNSNNHELQSVLERYVYFCYSLGLSLSEEADTLEKEIYSSYFGHLCWAIQLLLENISSEKNIFDFKYVKRFARVLFNIGSGWYSVSDYNRALEPLKIYLAMQSEQDDIFRVTAFYKLSECYKNLSDLKTAIFYLSEYIFHVEIYKLAVQMRKLKYPGLRDLKKQRSELVKRFDEGNI